MNQQEIVSFVLVVGAMALGHLVSGVLRRRLGPVIRPFVGPIVERMFPSLKFEPWLFEPIAAEDLPAKQRWFFDAHTPGFVSRGFTHLGDFVLRRDPEPSCVRFFISRDGTVIGGMNCYLKHQCIECMSVLLDGFYIETSTASCPQLPPEKHGLKFFCLRTTDEGRLIEHHLDGVLKTASTRGTSAAPLTAGDLQSVSNYGRQLSLNSLHKQGILGELPEFLRRKSDQVQADEMDEYSMARK